ncbi:hypothetical protein [Paracoccus laeviglucosivorans]|uniref:Phage tail tape measure protein, lambda family n=1 Tax=Paracoccus laeviglucosivorans TaxID=1197861 RepID=A0A521CX87_9RHOB|nr:hypothetical protein [Paracoccus laeviglucosivorans]SMO64086.1 hypothetical protein SAMN06265221_105247 [Paracoccus laeviglucosivorans]
MVASVIGALRVNLGLDSAQFSRGLGQSSSKLARFAAQAGKIAAGLVASFGTAMTAMGMGAVQAGAEIDRLSQVANTLPDQFQRWSAGAKSVGIEQEKLGDILKDVNDRVGDFVQTGGGPMADFFEKIGPKVGVTAQHFRNLSGADALQLYVSSLEKANVNQQDFTFYMEAMASDSTLLLPLLKNGGALMTEYGDRAQRMGAIMSGPMLASLREGKSAISEMRMAVEGMKNTIGAQAVPVIKALAVAVTAAATFFHQHAAVISDALRTLAGVAAVVAVAFAAKYAVAVGVSAVRAMVAFVVQSVALEMALGAQSRAAALASVATKGLAIAFGFLKAAIISTGIGAIVVGAGYLVGKFMQLVSASGGFSTALKLVGDAAREALDYIGLRAQAMTANLDGMLKDVQAGARDMFASLIGGAVEFANRYVGIYRGAYEAVTAIWSMLPAAIGDAAYQAANGLITAVGWMLTQAAKPIDAFIAGLNKVRAIAGAEPIELIGEIKLPEVQNPYAGKIRDAGAAARDAFMEGFNTDTFSAPSGVIDGLRASADELRGQADAYREASGKLAAAADAKPMTAWQRVKDTLAGTSSEIAVLGETAGGAAGSMDDLGDKTDKAGKKAKKAKDKLTPLQEVMKRLREENEKLKGTFGLSDTEVAVWENLKEAQVTATSATGQQIASLTRQNKTLETANERAQDLRSTFKDTFKSVASGAMSIKDALTNVIAKLLEMRAAAMWDNAFMGGGGMGGFSFANVGNWFRGRGDVLAGALRGAGLPAIPAFATGVKNFRGGLAQINERGGEVVSLPKGSDVVPHGLSKRMVDRAAAAPQEVNVKVGIDPRNGNVTGYVDQRARAWDGVSARAQQKTMPGVMADKQRRRTI